MLLNLSGVTDLIDNLYLERSDDPENSYKSAGTFSDMASLDMTSGSTSETIEHKIWGVKVGEQTTSKDYFDLDLIINDVASAGVSNGKFTQNEQLFNQEANYEKSYTEADANIPELLDLGLNLNSIDYSDSFGNAYNADALIASASVPNLLNLHAAIVSSEQDGFSVNLITLQPIPLFVQLKDGSLTINNEPASAFGMTAFDMVSAISPVDLGALAGVVGTGLTGVALVEDATGGITTDLLVGLTPVLAETVSFAIPTVNDTVSSVTGVVDGVLDTVSLF